MADGGYNYKHYCEAISADGSTYWLNATSDRVMALDDEGVRRVTSFEAPPATVWRGAVA